MSKFFGNGVSLKHDVDDGGTFTTFGQVLRIQIPGQEWDLVSFLVLGDTVDPMHVAPVQNAPTWECAVFHDQDETEQAAVNAIVGSDTAHSWQVVWPFTTLSQSDFEAKIYATENEQIVPKEGIIKVYQFVNTTVQTFS